MNPLNIFQIAFLSASLLALPAAYAATLSKADYKAGKTRISADYKADKAACASHAANAQDICLQEAKGKEKVARAELEYAYTGRAADRTKVLVAKAEAAYAVAKERCDDQSGNAKHVCIKEAKAVEIKALADAKMGKEIGEAKKDAAAEKRDTDTKMGKEIGEAKKDAAVDKLDADYTVAIEKCDALAGDAKSACIAAAKAKFGKN